MKFDKGFGNQTITMIKVEKDHMFEICYEWQMCEYDDK